MKNCILIFLCVIGMSSYAQNKISFDYDIAGNQILRSWCAFCHSKNSNEIPKEISEIKEGDLQKFFPTDVISYYPNPVKEQLYLTWEVINNNNVVAFELYNLNGQLIKVYKNTNNKKDFTVSFSEFPRNVYSFNLIYSNGDQKSIKIIKE